MGATTLRDRKQEPTIHHDLDHLAGSWSEQEAAEFDRALAEQRPVLGLNRRPTPAAGVVLAAGTSSRMGRNKLLLEVGGEPLVRRAVRAALAAGLEPVVVVVGHEAEGVRAALGGLGCRTVLNPGYQGGMTTSLRAGVAVLPAATPAAVMILADMPRVTAGMLAELAAAHAGADPARRPPLVLSDYGGVLAPPTLFDRALFDELLALPDDRCPRSVVRRHRDAAAVLRWPEAALADLDRPADLAMAT